MKFRWIPGKKSDTKIELLPSILSNNFGISPTRLPVIRNSPSEGLALQDDFWEINEGMLQHAPAGMYYEISVEIFFNARHSVVSLGVQGPEHTHSYRLQVVCQGCELNHEGQMVVGYKVLRENMVGIVQAYNNTSLNDLPPFNHRQPTTENLAGIIFQQLDKVIQGYALHLSSLTVWDSPTTAITVRRNSNHGDVNNLYDSG